MGLNRTYGQTLPAQYRTALREMRKQRSKWYRTLRTVIIIAAVLAATFLVLCFLVESLRRASMFKLVSVVFALCVGGAMCLPWITLLERERRLKKSGGRAPLWHRIVAYVFFGFIGLCVVLWIVSVFVIGDGVIAKMLDPQNGGTEISAGAFVFLRIALIMTLQAVAGTAVLLGVVRFGKNYVGLFAVMDIAIVYLDVWLSWLFAIVSFTRLEAGTVYPLQNTALWVIAVLAAVGLAVAGSIFYRRMRRKEIELFLKGDAKQLTEGDVDLIDAAETEGYDETAARLQQLKALREKGLITEEDFEAKKRELLEKI